MKALSLTQPWATLMSYGEKSIETRSWQPSPRLVYCRVAIHASQGFPRWAQELCADEYFSEALDRAGYQPDNAGEELPRGAVLATATLAGFVRVPGNGVIRPGDVLFDVSVTEQELAFGDFGSGRWLWVFRDVELLPEPIPARGALGVWNWERSVSAQTELFEARS